MTQNYLAKFGLAALLTCSASIANAELSGAADVSLLNSSRTNTDTDY